MKVIFSNYNFTPNWIKEYNFDYHIFDRSDSKEFLKDFPQDKITYVKNIGSDILDKFDWIISNYNNLPDVVLLSKSNLFKYISEEEFNLVKDNKTFTPLHTKHHKTVMPIAYYREDGMYMEKNNRWFLIGVPCRFVNEYDKLIGNKFKGQEYKPFSPGSNYILPKENILKHPKEFYEKLRSFLEYEIYPGEAFLIERDLYNIWS